ncbi:integrase, catalytic region, zinc finger, CCHC-type containing protein [Tanacetum coccineum]
MTTLADKAILSGFENRPPMLEKDMYDSCKSKMELYIMNKQHGRMILKSIENRPLTWPTIEENEVTRPKKYSELSATKAIQADCDVKETNIILQGLPPEVYVLVSNHRITKEIWGRQISFASGTSRTYTPGASGSNFGKQRTVICYNCKGEGHMSKQCTKPKRKQDDSWFKDKVLLVQAQANGQILHEEKLAFYCRSRNYRLSKPIDLSYPHVAYQDNDLDAYDSDCDELNTDKVALMAMLSSEQSNEAVQNPNSSAQQDALILSVIEQLKTQVVNCTKINLDNKSVNDTLTAELERYKEQVKVLKEGQNVDLKSKDNVSDSCAQSVEIDHLKQTLLEHLKKESLMQMVTLLKNDFKKEESRNIDREIALEKRIKQLDNIFFKRDQSAQTLETKLYDGNAIVIPDSEETLMLAEESHFETRFVPQTELSIEQAFWSQYSVNSLEPTLSSRPTKVEVLKELPKVQTG